MSREPQPNVPLAPLTTWKIGGTADWFCAPETEEDLTHALAWARARQLPVRILGRGSNILVSDDGLRGLVLCLRSFQKDRCRFEVRPGGRGQLEVSAGMSLPRLSKLVAEHGFSGYEFYIGIPGTVGGAVVMNAGFGPGDERQTANRCTEVRILDAEGAAGWIPYAEVGPIYRHTQLVDSDRVVLAARFALRQRSSPEAIRAVTAEHLGMRKARQPLTRPTAGSVFKGTADGVPAAVYIDRCGLKGYRCGDAQVSPKHANWIENLGSARATDVLDLIRHVREVVKAETGIELETEVRFLH